MFGVSSAKAWMQNTECNLSFLLNFQLSKLSCILSTPSSITNQAA